MDQQCKISEPQANATNSNRRKRKAVEEASTEDSVDVSVQDSSYGDDTGFELFVRDKRAEAERLLSNDAVSSVRSCA